MTQTAATILLYLVALFLTVVTLWPFSYATQTTNTKETDPQFFWLLIAVVTPFVMLIYFGAAFLISDRISEKAVWQMVLQPELSLTKSLIVAVTYVALSGWLWLRWRNPIAPSTRIIGPVIIAAVIILIIAGVIWVPNYEQTF